MKYEEDERKQHLLHKMLTETTTAQLITTL